jgi:hypothetical protein
MNQFRNYPLLTPGKALLILLLLALVTACGPQEPATPEVQETAESEADGAETPDNGYPGVTEEDTGYPGPAQPQEELSDTPPNPERELPAAEPDTGVIGGVLVWEVTENGFAPLTPVSFRLAEIVRDESGEPMMLRDSELSPQAQIFPTGVFVFQAVPPGTYGLVVDVGYAKFPVTDESGEPRLIDIAAGEALDLGQIITTLPSS